MKIILLRDVARLGRKSEVKDVPDGHAINFLIPRKLAVIATSENLKRVNEVKEKHTQSEEERLSKFKEILAQHTEPIPYSVDANEQGHLFKGIHAEDIAALLNTRGFSLSKENIVLEQPIKDIGVHTISLILGKGKGAVQLHVVKK